MSVFEISFSFSLEFSLSSSLVLSPTFFVLSVLRGFYSPKRLSVLNQNLCFFVCIWNFFPFFFKVAPSSYLVLSLTFLKCFSVFFWELSTSSFLLSVLLTFLTVTTFGVWSSLILSLFSLPLHSRNVKARLGGYGGNSGSPNNLLIFFDHFKLIIMEVVGKW